MKEFKISIPEGMVIDTENSSLKAGVIKFKKKEISLLEKVEKYIEEKFVYCDYSLKCTERKGEVFIKIPLPLVNEEWSFAAYDLCKEICKELKNAYPVHYRDLPQNYIFIYVKVREI